MRNTGLVLFTILFAITFYVGCQPKAEDENTSEVKKERTYVGSTSCQSCHTEEYNLWQESHHFHAMEEPTEKSVLGDFKDVTFSADGVDYYFSKEGADFKVAVSEGGSTDHYLVKYTFGIEPLQQYLIEFPEGKVQTLRATWDSKKNVWFHQREGETVPKHDWLHWSNQAQNWNSMCASCHSTDVKKEFNPNTSTYKTTFSEINVACESCHGPGSEHLQIAGSLEYTKNQTGLFAKATNNIEQVEQCAPCHARRTELTEQFALNEKFLDHFMPQTLNAGFYEPDGQISEEDYVYGSFASSRMYHEDVDCLDCHNPHSNKLKLEGNALCLQCHESTYDRKEHHFHEIDTESAQCVNCHMTGKTYMGNDFRRDHSFRIPRPDQSVTHGTSNACSNCHSEKPAEWAAEQVKSWYGETRAKHFSDYLLAGIDGDASALVTLADDSQYPEIARATAIEYLEGFPPEVYVNNLQKWATDSKGLVRLEVAKRLAVLPVSIKTGLANTVLNDELRAVRLVAYRSLLNDYDALSENTKTQWRAVESEYLEFLKHNADFKEGQQNIAQYYTAKQNPEMAIASLQRAIEIDSLFPEPYRNLAVTQSQIGDNRGALQTLTTWIAKFPENENAYYLRSLLFAEDKDFSAASKDINVALRLNPNPRYFYNAVLIEQNLGNAVKAKQLLKAGIQQFPEDQNLRQLQIN